MLEIDYVDLCIEAWEDKRLPKGERRAEQHWGDLLEKLETRAVKLEERVIELGL